MLLAATASGAGAWAPTALVVSGELVLADGDFVLDRQVLVLPGARLVLRNATIWFDAPCACDDVVLDHGEFIVEDSRLGSHRVPDDVDHGAYVAVFGYASRLEMRRSDVAQAGGFTFNLAGLAPSLVEDSAFRDGVRGPVFARGVVAEVRGSTFERLVVGLTSVDASLVAEDNTFRAMGVFGLYLDQSIAGDKYAISSAVARGNRFETSQVGLYHRLGTPSSIEGNAFLDNTLGLRAVHPGGFAMLHQATPRVEGNLFRGNVDAVEWRAAVLGPGEAAGPTIVLRGNCLEAPTISLVRVVQHPALSLQADARGNWWGQASGPGPADVDGAASVDPWLAERPACPAP